MKDPQIETLLSEANSLREQDQLADSLKVYFSALTQLVGSNLPLQLVHCLSGMSLVYKVMARRTGSSVFMNLTLAYAQEATKVEANDLEASYIAFMGYADAVFMTKDFQTALPLFEKALNFAQNRSLPEQGRIKGHIGGCAFLLGDKTKGIQLMEAALLDVRTGDMASPAVRTWETGILNGLAKAYAMSGNMDKSISLAQESLSISTQFNLPIRIEETTKIVDQLSKGDNKFEL